MDAENANRMLRCMAGSDYDVMQWFAADGSPATIRHVPCGHVFTRAVQDIARQGVYCARCAMKTKNTFITDVTEARALSIYHEIVDVVGLQYTIYGDTSDYSHMITLTKPGVPDCEIKIQDLLEHKNLPDHLVHCYLEKRSTAMEILQEVAGAEYEVIDDFQTLADEVRIRKNVTETVQVYLVADFLKIRLMQLGGFNE